MNKIFKTPDSVCSNKNKNPAIYCLTFLSLILIGFAATAWFQMLQLIPLKAINHQQAVGLIASAEQIKILTEAKFTLLGQKQTLEANLTDTKKKASEAAAANESRGQLLSAMAETHDIEGGWCEIIVENIKMVESQLNRDDFFRLRDTRETEAETVLELYQKQLAECRDRAIKNDQHQYQEQQAMLPVKPPTPADAQLP